MHRALIAVGSNLCFEGQTAENTVNLAFRKLKNYSTSQNCYSRIFRSDAYPEGSGPPFANAVLGLETPLGPEDLLESLHGIEAEFRRTRSQRWGPRTLDLDLIDHDGAVLPDRQVWDFWHGLPPEEQARRSPDRLILPHPRAHERAFVLKPLCDIAPDWRHPVLGLTAQALLAALPAGLRDGVVPI